jgi:cytochrome c553
MTRTCRKIRYRDRIAALLALASTARGRHNRRPKDEARAYACPECHGWHLTSRRSRGDR